MTCPPAQESHHPPFYYVINVTYRDEDGDPVDPLSNGEYLVDTIAVGGCVIYSQGEAPSVPPIRRTCQETGEWTECCKFTPPDSR